MSYWLLVWLTFDREIVCNTFFRNVDELQCFAFYQRVASSSLNLFLESEMEEVDSSDA
jgi:hypothetical protein